MSKKLATTAFLALVAAFTASAVLVLPANSQQTSSGSSTVSAADAFAAVSAAPPRAPEGRLATEELSPVVVARGTAGPDQELKIEVTRSGLFCIDYRGTNACGTTGRVAQEGLFIAAVRCGPESAEVVGIVPDNVERVSTVGADRDVSIPVAADGFVGMTLAGGRLKALDLGDKVASFALSPDCDRSNAVIQKATPLP